MLYKVEKEAGFSPKDLFGNSISYLVPLQDNPTFNLKVVDGKIINLCKTVASETQDIILYPLKCILVSTAWNGNDDIFTGEELWAARHTSSHKPVNYEHAEDDIIGHMISSQTMSDDGKELPDDLTLDELPSKFHIIASSVLYKHWSDETRQKRMNKILDEIPENKWFVSVECIFPKFDYALRDDSGSQKIVSRNSETAFLTKCLRCYGGKGISPDGKSQVGRVIRNMTFSGKGITKKPANPESIILTKKYDLFFTSENLVYNNPINVIGLSESLNLKAKIKEVHTMDEKEFQKQLDVLKMENVKLQASLQETNVQGFKIKIDELTKIVAEKDAKVISTESLLKTAQEQLKASQDKIIEIDKIRVELSEKFTKMEADKKFAERLSLVATKLKLDVEKTKKLVDTLSILSDDAFASTVELHAEMLKGSQTIVVETDEQKKLAEKAKVDSDKASLDKIEKEKVSASLVTQTQDNGVEKVRASICDFVTQYLVEDEKK